MLALLCLHAMAFAPFSPGAMLSASPVPSHCERSRCINAAVSGPLSGALPEDFALAPPNTGRSVILFDGVCNFCNRWVSFVLDNDSEKQFCFASMQSKEGQRLLQLCGRESSDLSTFVVIDETGFYTQSTAAVCPRPLLAHFLHANTPQPSAPARCSLNLFAMIDPHCERMRVRWQLRVGQKLRAPALNVLAAALMPVPTLVRDGVYRVVADNRYSILGRDADGATPSCKLRAPEEAERFLS